MERRRIPGLKPALPPHIQWEEDGFSPAKYLETFDGPEFVILKNADGSSVSFGPLVDPTRPFIAFSHRRRTKAYAETVFPGGVVRSDCPTFEIPKDYVGWFEVIPPDGPQPECLPSVGAVALTKCRYFLVRSVVAGFKVTESEEGQLDLLEECKFYPGEVLQVEKVCKKIWRTEKMDASKEGTSNAGTKFLKCHDLNNNAFCLPLAHPGQFSAIGTAQSQDPNAVYQIWNVLDRCEFPTVVRLSFGWAPRLKSPSHFTGLLKIMSSCRPDSLLLASVVEDGTVLLELPLDAKVKFYRAKDKAGLAECEALKYGVYICKRKVFPYAISMKPLDLKYAAEDTDKPVKYMPSARDMESFSRADVYPPPMDEPLPEFWSLSFKDPEYMYETLRVKTLESQGTGGGESGDHMPEAVLKRLSISHEKAVKKDTRSGSILSQAGYGHTPPRRGSKIREEPFKLHQQREAQC